ncbi:MAG: nuclear transport factor 2 family protein [Deltaproteobacteria bacterium]|nr:MAG: nuclear transport factor 2 family protein [Deltaproteobacteria bacterium]
MSVTSRPPTRVAENLALVRRFWDDLYAHEFDKVGAYFTAGAVYDDVPIPAARVVGPAAIVRKLRIGFARVERHTHHLHRMVADDETVVTEHTEDWHFAPDHVVALPFVSVQVIESSKISLWRDYSNIDTLLSAAPSWWLQHVTASWAEG